MSYLLIIVLIGVLILLHELGHFIAAKIMHIPVRIFSIGFGPRLCKMKWKQTELRLSLIPLGGYVLLDVSTEEELYSISWKNRVVFTISGPLANIGVACVGMSVISILVNDISVSALFISLH
jgi:regulator of sigma E protease